MTALPAVPEGRIPDFLILGAARCGTTSLFAYLKRHPSVTLPSKKEIHFFDLNFRDGLGWYRAFFPPAGGATGITGEASPYYLFHPHVPSRVADALPKVRLIAMLRDPVARAYSHYHLIRHRGREPLSFEEAVDREEERLAGTVEGMMADPGAPFDSHRYFSYLARGRYAEQLGRWFERFPRERFLILKSEDLYLFPGLVLRSVTNFLGIPPVQEASFVARNRGSYPPMAGAMRERLVEYFRPHNRKLYELLGRDFGWEDQGAPADAGAGGHGGVSA